MNALLYLKAPGWIQKHCKLNHYSGTTRIYFTKSWQKNNGSLEANFLNMYNSEAQEPNALSHIDWQIFIKTGLYYN